MNEFTYRGLSVPSEFLTDEILAWKIGVDQALGETTVEPLFNQFYARIHKESRRVIDVYRESPDGSVEYWNYYNNEWRGADSIADTRKRISGSHDIIPCDYGVVEDYKKDNEHHGR